MPYPFRRGRTVTVTNYTRDDRTAERTVDTDASFTMPGCAFNPGTTDETDDGSTVTQYPRVYGRYGADIRPDSTIAISGVPGVFEVNGEVAQWRNDLTGTEACCEIKLIRKRGQV